MAESARVLDVVYALRETDRREGFFRPVVETKSFIWRLEIKEFDKLGLLVNHIEIKAHNTSALSLEEQSELLKDNITYLEDFKLIEYDRHHATMLLRSRVPKQLGVAVS